MGAWGTGSWENDAALDWLEADLEDEDSIREALEALFAALDDGFAEVDVCNAAIAAAELVAALRGAPGQDLPPRARVWVLGEGDGVPDDLVSMAIEAVRAIDASSELQELFDEDERNEPWHRVMADLIGRLRFAPPAEA
jgi:hypothetical protein